MIRLQSKAFLCLLQAGNLALLGVIAGVEPAFAQVCDRPGAELIAVEGDVELMRDGTPDWIPAGTGDSVCLGDSVRVLVASRAELLLADGNSMKLDEGTTLRVTEDSNDGYFLIELFRGLIHLISHDSRSLKFSTAYTNAGLDGTEFLLEVTDGRTVIQVIDGAVIMGRDDNENTLRLESGQVGIAAEGVPLRSQQFENIQEEMAWTFYFDPIWSGELPAPTVEPGVAESGSPDFLAARAASLLRRGQYQSAVADIDEALSIDPGHPEALAQRASTELALNRTESGLEFAELAVAADPDSVVALLVLSYARQSAGDRQGAEEAVAAAVERVPDDSLAIARLAELRLIAGDVNEATQLALRSIQLDPGLYRGHLILGFSELRNVNLDAAIVGFESAIKLEPSAPLPRLGLGLALARKNELDAGRKALELAVALDPNDPLLRSYVAQIFFEEGRYDVARSELGLSGLFDPDEPTASVFSAPQHQATNRPIAALQDLERVAQGSEQVLVNRSSLYLVDDLAVRSSGRGQIYRELDLADRGQTRALLSLLENPASFEARRLLADTWSARPDHELARGSDYTQALLLQPVNVTPIPPELGESNLLVAQSSGPGVVAFDRYSNQVTRDHLAGRASFLVSGQGTEGERISVSGLNGKFSYSFGHYGVRTDGFRENSDLDSRINNGLIQYQFDADTSVLLELRSSESDRGDRKVYFNPENFVPVLQQQESVDSALLGFRRTLNERATLIGSTHHQEGEATLRLGETTQIINLGDGYANELVGIVEFDRWNLTAGALSSQLDRATNARYTFPVQEPPFEIDVDANNAFEIGQESLFAYGDYRLNDAVTVTLGGSIETLVSRRGEREQFNPKLGVVWVMPSGLIFRAAAFRTLQGALVSRQNATPRLEPTQVAGFAQYLFGTVGDDAKRIGIGMDHSLGSDIFIGADLSAREVTTTFLVQAEEGLGVWRPIPLDESFGRAYLRWLHSDAITFSAELERDEIDNNGVVLFNAVTELRTTRAAFGMKHFRPNGFSAGIKLQHIEQSGTIAPNQGSQGGLYRDSDQFWVTDAFAAYRFPQRRGELSLNVHNLFDEEFKYQDRDPESPRVVADRLMSVRFTLAW